MKEPFLIGKRKIGPGEPAYIIAEMSANHNQSFESACEIVHAIKESGADAVKLQTYTADTLTIDSDREDFLVGKGTLWEGRKLYDLYKEAHTPWDWQPKIFELARSLGLDCFSSPFDPTSVDFLETLDPPAYKIASFELVDLPLIEYVASKGRPIIMSTGMGSIQEIADAVEVVRSAGVPFVLLKCTSAYPSPPSEINLQTIASLSEVFDVSVGLSDHSLGIAVPVAAVALGAVVIEKHFTISREIPGPDSAFSLEPDEFREMVEAVRVAEQSVGRVNYSVTEKEQSSKIFRRSLYVVENIAKGEVFTADNIRSIRPGYGIPPKYTAHVIGKKASRDLPRGTALKLEHVSDG